MPQAAVALWEGSDSAKHGLVIEAGTHWGDPEAPACDYDRARAIDPESAEAPEGLLLAHAACRPTEVRALPAMIPADDGEDGGAVIGDTFIRFAPNV